MRYANVYERLCCSAGARPKVRLVSFTLMDMLTCGLVGMILGGMAAIMVATVTQPGMTQELFEVGTMLGLAAGSLRRGIDIAGYLHDLRCPHAPSAPRTARLMPGMLFPFLIFAWLGIMSGFPALMLLGVAAEAAVVVVPRAHGG